MLKEKSRLIVLIPEKGQTLDLACSELCLNISADKDEELFGLEELNRRQSNADSNVSFPGAPENYKRTRERGNGFVNNKNKAVFTVPVHST